MIEVEKPVSTGFRSLVNRPGHAAQMRAHTPGLEVGTEDHDAYKGSVSARGGRSLSNLVGRYPMGREALSPKFSCGTTVSSEIWTSKVF